MVILEMQVVAVRGRGRGEVSEEERSEHTIYLLFEGGREGVKWPLHFSLSLSFSSESSPFSLYTENIVVDVSQSVSLGIST